MAITKATQDVIEGITATGSTTARTLANRFADVVNVKDFGAVGDGVTDDTAAIQAAINSVSSGQKIEIFFPRGNYIINGTLTYNQRFISFVLDEAALLSGSGTVNGYTFASTNWQFVKRIKDRLFVGPTLDANDGTLWTNGPASWSQDWVEIELNTQVFGGGLTSTSQLATISQRGYNAICGASRTSDNPLANSEGTMGVAAFVVADKVPTSGNNSSAYGFYNETRRKGNAGWAHTCEFDAIARSANGIGSAPQPALLTPQTPFAAPSLTGAWFSNSRPDITDGGDVAAGLAFINNAGSRTSTQGRYRIGILFDQRSILGADLTNPASATNIGNAIALGTGHAIGWWNGSIPNTPADYVTGGEGTLYFYNFRGSTFATSNISASNDNVNYLIALGAPTNSAPSLSVGGPDVNCSLRLSPKGTGSVTAFLDNATSLGNSTVRWSQVWAANGTIQTSDKTEKTEILESSLGLEFIKQLNPVSYKFIVGGNKIVETDPVNGVPTKIEPIAGRRTHFGLIAQEVKSVIPDGVDFGGWIKADMNDPQSTEGLRYDEFIAPLIKAVQQLSEKIEKLENK
jgi:hypothetical protein